MKSPRLSIDRDLHPVIGELRAARKGWKLSQSEVAERAGLGRTFISMAETGHRGVSFGLVTQWADTLGYEVILKPKF